MISVLVTALSIYLGISIILGIFTAGYPQPLHFNWGKVLLPGYRKRRAFREGYLDMKKDGSLTNPSYARYDPRYMNHKNEKIYRAYIAGGDMRLNELFADKAGTSKIKLRLEALKSHDQTIIESVKALDEAKKPWQSEFNKLSQ